MYASDAAHANKALQDKLLSLYTLHRDKAVDLGFRPPYLNLLKALGDPHKSLPPVLHIAGTNGKGSVMAMLRAILEQAGYRVHVYSSPHLVRFNERIVLAGQEIGDEALEAILDETLALNNGAPLTFFEITTALAFAAFARNPADVLLLETGLGGRLDCTNVIEAPLASIIARIGYDHMEFLGNTLTQIAGEKAGILKPGCPCILAPQEYDEAIDVFEQKAASLSVPLIKTNPAQGRRSGLTGPHQLDNAATALACLPALRAAGFIISETAVDKGLENVRWPARLQRLSPDGLPAGCELWLDGGHNESAGRALGAQAKLWSEQDGKKLHLILGMMKTKDPLGFVRPLLPYTSKITCVAVPGEQKAFPPEDLARFIAGATPPQSDTQTTFEPDIHKALNITDNAPDSRILVTGSLYLAGMALNLYRPLS